MNSGYDADTVGRKSMSGYMVKLGEATVIWGTERRTAVMLSTFEAEYYALTHAVQEVL